MIKRILPTIGMLLMLGGCAEESPGTVTPEHVPSSSSAQASSMPSQPEMVAENLRIPWDIAFLPDGDLLVTERPGTLLRIGKDRTQYVIDGVNAIGEGGLLGIALHPKFIENRYLYLYSTTRTEGRDSNRVERYRLDGDELINRTVILGDIPAAVYHDGGRIAFGPDGYLYVTTGDATDETLAQDTRSLAGKILRVGDDGSIPADNPFGNAVYSYGHRNVEGITWDGGGHLWSTEHGRSGALSGYDELNRIEKGGNYGWPVIQGPQTGDGMTAPLLQSGPDVTWAPGSAAYHDGSVFFGGLKGETLYEAVLGEGGGVARLASHFTQTYGRIRTAVTGPDGMLYMTTSNTDGRGSPKDGDDKIIRIDPTTLR